MILNGIKFATRKKYMNQVIHIKHFIKDFLFNSKERTGR